MSLASLISPFATLAVLGVAGLGVADLIAPHAPREAQAALAPVLTLTAVCITSPLVLFGSPPLATCIAVLAALTIVTAARHTQSLAVARKAMLPAGLACVVIAVYASPAIRHQTWAAATTGNQDAYLWVSQARSLEHGLPDGPVRTTPDRAPYVLLSHREWPTAIPTGVAELASVTGVDPVQAYGVFSVIIAAMLALGVFFGARGCLHWSPRRSAIATTVVSFNGLVLLSSFYGWQAQLLLTTAATLMVLMLPDCFERGAGMRECVGPALFAASAMAVYGWTVAPFVVVAAATSVVWSRRAGAGVNRVRTLAVRLGTVSLLAVAFGADAIARALITLAHGGQQVSTTVLNFWNQYAWAFPSDGLGLVPRSPRDTPGITWEVVAGAVAAVLIIRALRSARSSHNPRGTVLAAAGLTIIVELAALLVTGSSPYPSLKLMAYSTPLLTLLVLGPQLSRSAEEEHGSTARLSTIGTALVNVLGVCLFLTTSTVALATGFTKTRPATNVLPVARAATALPAGKVVLVSVEDAWNQVWLAYFLRDRPIAIRSPSVAFLGYSAKDAAHAQKYDTPADFVIRDRRDGKFGIYPAKNHPGK